MKFRKNTPEPSPSEMKGGMDFSQILGRAKNRYLQFLKKWSLPALGVVALLAVLFPWGTEKTKKEIISVIPIQNNAYSYWVDANKGDTLITATGSVIIIPSNAFTHKDGSLVNGNVRITWKEFQSVAELIAAGIPMVYDSAGQSYHFETAGMIDIHGFQNEQPVYINPQNPITLSIASPKQTDQFNAYFFDSVSGNWSYANDLLPQRWQNNELWDAWPDPVGESLKSLGLDSLSVLFEKSTAMDPILEQKINNIPGVVQPQNRTIQIDFSISEFPELKPYKNVLFEIDKNALPEGVSLTEYSGIELSLNEEEGGYLIQLKNGDKTITFNAKPVFADSSQYLSTIQSYQKQKELNVIQNEKWQKEFEQELNKLDGNRKLMVAQILQQQKQFEMMQEINKKEDLVVRTFQIKSFGIWNCDCPNALPSGGLIALKCVNNQGKSLAFDHVYLVDKVSKMMYTYYPTDLGQFRYNPATENILVGVARSGEIAVIYPESFENQVVKSKGTCNAVFELKGGNFESVSQISQLLQLDE